MAKQVFRKKTSVSICYREELIKLVEESGLILTHFAKLCGIEQSNLHKQINTTKHRVTEATYLKIKYLYEKATAGSDK